MFLPVISLLHLECHVCDFVAEFVDDFHDVLAGEGSGLVGLGQLRVQLKKLSEVRVGPERRVRSDADQETLQGRATTLKELEKENGN